MSRRRRWIVLNLVAALVAAGLFCFVAPYCTNPLDPLDAGRQVEEGRYVGQTREAILGRFGKPSSEWAGVPFNPPLRYAQKHPSAVTLTYARRTGTLYLCFEPVNGEMVCFSSTWVPTGVIIN